MKVNLAPKTDSGRPQKIIYFITKSVWGGAAKYVLDLASGLDESSYEPFIAAGGGGLLVQKGRREGITFIEIPHFGRDIKIIADVISFFEVSRVLRREKPDVIHVNSSKAGGICGLAGYLYNIARRKKVKMIFTVHGWPFMEERPKWQKFFIKIVNRLTIFFYEKIIVISKLDFDISKRNSDRVVFIHNGIDADALTFFSKHEAREKLGISAEACAVATIGEWTRNKGWDMLLEATIPLFVKFPPIRLVMIGSGENADKPKLLSTIHKKNLQDKVKAVESLENAAQYLKAFDIFAFPSRKEGLPYALLEAGLAELPVVASSVGGNTDIIEHEKTGLVVLPNNSDLLRAAIERLVENPEERKKFGTALREKVAREFTLSRMRERTYALYR